jgi:hypothetical protein
MITTLAGLPGKVKTFLDRITVARANGLNNITAGPVALSATALSTATWTASKAGFLDQAISSAITHYKYTEYTATGAFTFTWPAGVDIVCVTLIGGGSSGGGGVTNTRGGAGGAGGETIYRNYFPRLGVTTTTGSVGAGGAAAAAGANGTAGTISTFGTLTAAAGRAGTNDRKGATGGGWGPQPVAQPDANSTKGDDGVNIGINFTGANGGNSATTAGVTAGAGGQNIAWLRGGIAGTAGSGYPGGGGGGCYSGAGGIGGNGTPTAGSAPAANTGAGGGGGGASTIAQSGSGAGAAGYCVLEYMGA